MPPKDLPPVTVREGLTSSHPILHAAHCNWEAMATWSTGLASGLAVGWTAGHGSLIQRGRKTQEPSANWQEKIFFRWMHQVAGRLAGL